MVKLFFLLSGEHETLPVSELKAILETGKHVFKISEKLDQVLRLEADLNCINTVSSRAAFTKLCGLELLSCEAKANTILEVASSVNFKEILENGESFAVRVKRVKEYAPKISSMVLEGKLGELVLSKAPRAKVNLKKPDKTFIGILADKFVFGLKLAESFPKQFVGRRPRKKPFFHPSAMQPKLARCMVNLAYTKTGDLVLDPFCGTGSTLIEATLMGCRALGLDIQRRMTKGTRRNMAYFDVDFEGLVVADARNLPVKKVDCVVTDPPYGRSATTFKRTTKQIVEEVLNSVHGMLDRGQRVCIAAPKTLNIGSMGMLLGYRHLESFFVYVHRSLTREIAIFEKV